MGIVNSLRSAVTGGTATLYECRNCGTTLSEAAETCEECGADDVACYRF